MRSTITVVYTDYYFQAAKSKVAVFKISSICLHIPQVRREICIFFSLVEMIATHYALNLLHVCMLNMQAFSQELKSGSLKLLA